MTPFASQVYEMIARIPRGRVMTYAGVAAAIRRPRAVRAVGTALRQNPTLVTVPCHRVVKSSGQIGEYARGRAAKEALLRGEGVLIVDGRVSPLEDFLYTAP